MALKIAFRLLGADGWTGGYQYLLTLISAIAGLPDSPVEPVLYAPPGTAELLQPFREFVSDIRIDKSAPSFPHTRQTRLGSLRPKRIRSAQRAYESAGIGLVFQHSEWLGFTFGLPTLAWLGDFQHRRLPRMFSPQQLLLREARFRAVLRSATSLLVMSEQARDDCRRWYPRHLSKVAVMSFVVDVPADVFETSARHTRSTYALPERFFYLPNQFWKHKNHGVVLEALRILREANTSDVVVAVSGNPVDNRDPHHVPRLLSRIGELGLREQFRVLGMVPRRDMWSLMRASVAVINPSLYEGWSTTVEEAKSLGVPVVVSDLPVHREQAAPGALYFNPHDPGSLAEALRLASTWPAGPHEAMELSAAVALPKRRDAFGRQAVSVAESTVARFESGVCSW